LTGLLTVRTPASPHRDTFSIVYNKQAATYYRDNVSLTTVNGRSNANTTCPTIQHTPRSEYLLNNHYSFSTSTVHDDSEADEFYLHAVIEREPDVASPEKAEHSRVLGVDSNVDDHIVVTSIKAFVGNADYLSYHRCEFEK
jgi:transposase